MGDAKAQGRNERQGGIPAYAGMAGMAGMTGNDREWQAWTGVGGRWVSGLRETHGRTGNGILASALWGELTLTVIRAWDTIRYGRGTAGARGRFRQEGRRLSCERGDVGVDASGGNGCAQARRRGSSSVSGMGFHPWGGANDNVEYAVDGQARSRGRLAARGSRSVDGGDVAATRFRARSSAGAL